MSEIAWQGVLPKNKLYVCSGYDMISYWASMCEWKTQDLHSFVNMSLIHGNSAHDKDRIIRGM